MILSQASSTKQKHRYSSGQRRRGEDGDLESSLFRRVTSKDRITGKQQHMSEDREMNKTKSLPPWSSGSSGKSEAANG